MLVQRDRAVPRDLVDRLCELATWAPNHKRTWPMRFAVAEGDGRARLGEAIADAMQAHPKSFMMGQDIAKFSILGVSAGLHERFGLDRIRNSPISESAMVGVA